MILPVLRRACVAAAIGLGALLAAHDARAFCGFYVGGADAKLFNDATMVVMMREGTRTVLSMQNTYKGPPERFAMVVPVPVVLQKENVKTLDKKLFEHIDQLASPRLVEYWEEDPCFVAPPPAEVAAAAPMAAPRPRAASAGGGGDLGVKIEAQFTVGEYEIVILSAKDSGGLETWLHREKYTIPDGAEPYFRPYVASGSKFFVAKVDPSKVKIENGLAELSPLRFHYDSEEFKLPVRLGLINSSGTQDLIVHILGVGTRYEVANYPNVTIPTNLDVAESAQESFGAFYTTLFDRTLEKNPKAVVTEYAWEPTSCDPCPGPALALGELATFGVDVLPSTQRQPTDDDPLGAPAPQPRPSKPSKPGGGMRFRGGWGAPQFVLTRLHARYMKSALGDDLVFKAATPIVGGREVRTANNALEHGAQPSSFNNFQGRYAVRHPWTGPITCKEPVRGRWGGPPGGQGAPPPRAAKKLGLAPRAANADLASFVRSNVPELGVTIPGAPPAGVVPTTTAAAAPPSASAAATTSSSAADGGEVGADGKKSGGCAGCATSRDARVAGDAAGLVLLGAVAAAVRRLRRRR